MLSIHGIARFDAVRLLNVREFQPSMEQNFNLHVLFIATCSASFPQIHIKRYGASPAHGMLALQICSDSQLDKDLRLRISSSVRHDHFPQL
jgi:hypothetical protein